jgi:hypothetical protein
MLPTSCHRPCPFLTPRAVWLMNTIPQHLNLIAASIGESSTINCSKAEQNTKHTSRREKRRGDAYTRPNFSPSPRKCVGDSKPLELPEGGSAARRRCTSARDRAVIAVTGSQQAGWWRSHPAPTRSPALRTRPRCTGISSIVLSVTVSGEAR